MEGLRPGGELGPDLVGADHRLQRVEDRGDRDQPEQDAIDATGPAAPPGGDPGAGEHEAHDDAHVAVQRMGEGQRRGGRRHVAERWHDGAAHEGPVGEDEGGVEGRHVGAEDEEGEGRRRAEGGEQGEALAPAATREAGRVSRPDEQEREKPGDGHRGGEVGGDRFPRVAEADRLATKPGLEADEGDRAERGADEAGAIAMVDDGEESDPQHHDPDHGRDEAVDPLRPRFELERGDGLSVAEGPIRAAKPRVRGPHDDAHDDEGERHGERRRDELLEAGHRTSASGPSTATGPTPGTPDRRRDMLGTSGADCIVPAREARRAARAGHRRQKASPPRSQSSKVMPLAASRGHHRGSCSWSMPRRG